MERNGFVFYRSFYEALCALDPETRLACYDALMNYGLNGVEPEAEGVIKAVFILFKPQIDANNKRYANGCKGGKPKSNQDETKTKPNSNQNITKETPKEKDKEKEKDKDKEKDKEKVKEKVKKKSTLSLYEDVKANYPLSENMDLTLTKWFTYRDNIRKPLGDKSIEQLIEKVIALERQYGYIAVAKCFDNSIDNGYQGVFFDKISIMPIKDNKSDVDDWFREELGG